jgi:hypothetical protein
VFVPSSSAVDSLLSSFANLRYPILILGGLTSLKLVWKASLRILGEMCEDIDDFRLKRRASKSRLQMAQSAEMLAPSKLQHRRTNRLTSA